MRTVSDAARAVPRDVVAVSRVSPKGRPSSASVTPGSSVRKVRLLMASTRQEEMSTPYTEQPLLAKTSAIVSPGGYADQVALVAHLDALAAGGIDGFAFYNYGLIRLTHLEWIGASRGAWC